MPPVNFERKAMKNLYPLKLSFVAKYRCWGGSGLKNDFGKEGDLDKVGETWELTVRDDEMSYIVNGVENGASLSEYIKKHGNAVVSPEYDGGHFPLLIKLIDAEDKLSVQVHPDDKYARDVENDMGKTEMWYIVSAKPDAKIIYGLRDGITSEDYARAVKNGNIEDAMKYCSVCSGETYFIPSGLVHAIGEGIIIAEIQQNSDLTYRVYDYCRRQDDGSFRELHIEKALSVVRPFSEDEIEILRYERGKPHGALASCRYFTVYKEDIDGEKSFDCDEESFRSLLCVDGEGYVTCGGDEYPLKKGDSYFLPAGLGEYKIAGKLCVIISSL